MLDLTGIKNIIFDLGGVILNIDYQLTSDAFKQLGASNFDDIYSQAKQNDVFDRLETGRLEPQAFRDYMKEFIPNATNDQIDDAWNAMLLQIPSARVDLLKRLSKEYRIFLLSNTNTIHIDAFNQIVERDYYKELFNDLFEQHYYSSEIGYRKPNADSFEYVLQQNGLLASETFFIDDSEQHLTGANKVGLRTHFLQPEEDIIRLF